MKIKRFTATDFRNIESCDLEFDDGVNLLIGNNAQGKTNVIEGIYLFSRGRSFRCSDDRDMIRFGAEGFRIGIEFECDEDVRKRHTEEYIPNEKDKKYILNSGSLGSDKKRESLEYACFGRERPQRQRKKNGYKISRIGEMISSFRSVLFYPDDLGLIKEGPESRRSFLNIATSQCFPTYLDDYTRYKSALDNRNRLLKVASKGMHVDEGELRAWSSSMAEYASYVYCRRVEYVGLIREHVRRLGLGFSDGREEITLSYGGGIENDGTDRESVRAEYEHILTKNIEKEKIVGSSLYGPHRDDLLVYINGVAARSFASQGQQRSAVLSMKLAEGEVIREIYGEYPVFLFDDVLSELDERRRSYVIGGMENRQVIVSCCENDELVRSADGVIRVEGGRYVSTHR